MNVEPGNPLEIDLTTIPVLNFPYCNPTHGITRTFSINQRSGLVNPTRKSVLLGIEATDDPKPHTKVVPRSLVPAMRDNDNREMTLP